MITTKTPRKTAKYYRTVFSSGSIRECVSLLPEVIRKFGTKRWSGSKYNDNIYIRHITEFHWNHRIERLCVDDKGVSFASIYWQGDSTDGTTSVDVSRLVNGHVIPAKHEWIGDRTYCEHGDLRISAEEFAEAIRAVAKYLAPEAINARKEAERKAELTNKVFDYVDTLQKTKDEAFWNGRMSVQELLEKKPELLYKDIEELKGIVSTVFKNNNKSAYWLRGGRREGSFEFNLNY